MINSINFESKKIVKEKKNIIIVAAICTLIIVFYFIVQEQQKEQYDDRTRVAVELHAVVSGILQSEMEEKDDNVRIVLNQLLSLFEKNVNDRNLDNFSESLNTEIKYLKAIEKYYKLTGNELLPIIEVKGKLLVNNALVKEKISSIYNNQGTKGSYYLLTILDIWLNYSGMIILILFFFSYWAKEYEKNTIRFLITQPLKKGTILLNKFITSSFFSIFFLICSLFFAFTVGSVADGFGSFMYPILVEGDFLTTIPLYSYVLQSLILNFYSIGTLMGMLGFLSYLTKNSSLTLFLALFLSIGVSIGLFLIIGDDAFLYPLSLFNSGNFLKVKGSLEVGNSFYSSLFILFISTILFLIGTHKLSERKFLTK